jgi:signal transduction histidine kinase
VEIETLLKNKNKHLVLEQDQQIHLATLNERNRIAREIHDNVGHMLSRGILLLGAIKTMNSDENIKPQLEMLANTLDESMEKMRSSVHDLHDDSIDLNKNFGDIIKELSNFKVSTELDFENNLPKEVKFSLIGILKEGVTNIIKHSNGDSVSIILHQNRSFCTLSISDNGKVDSDIKKKIQSGVFEGIGLENIKQRANSCNGDAYFYCNDGFTVFARLNF